ncbi:tetratricopeptide repeat protein, partial [Amycolatopsis sp. NPDC003731]
MNREYEAPSNSVSGSVYGSVVQAGNITGHVVLHGPPGQLPYRFGRMPPLAGAFQDRAELDMITMVGVDDGVPTTILSGLAGVGKTQVAVAAVERAWRSGEIDLLAWINAGSRDAIVSAYSALVAELTGIADAEPELAPQRLRTWLSDTSARWMLVFDGLKSPSDLHGLWPPAVRSGRVLVTTRRPDIAPRGRRRRLVEVKPFSPAEAHAYLHAALADEPALLDGVDELAHDLGYLPLALAQAAAYLLDRHISCAEYRLRFADQRIRLSRLFPEPAELPDGHQATVAATWSLSMDRADRLPPIGVARPLLQTVSLLDSGGVPLELFSTGAVGEFLAERTGRAVRAGEPREGLDVLRRLGLVHLDQRALVPVVLVHPLVQRAARDGLTEPELAEPARVAADGLMELWPDVEYDPAIGAVLRANATALIQVVGDELWQHGAHPLLVRAGRSLGESGQVAEAVAYFDRLADTADARLGAGHPTTFAIRAQLAIWRGEAGDRAGAAAALAELVDDQLRVLGPDHPNTLTTRNNLAYWLGEAGDPVRAATELEAVLADRMRVLGPDHPNTLTTRNNLAQWRGEAGDPTGAAAALAELLADQFRVLGPDHPNTLTTRNNLAQWRGEAGDPTGAAAALA